MSLQNQFQKYSRSSNVGFICYIKFAVQLDNDFYYVLLIYI